MQYGLWSQKRDARALPPESPWLDLIDWESSVFDIGFRNFTPCCPLAFLTSLRFIDAFMDAVCHLSSEATHLRHLLKLFLLKCTLPSKTVSQFCIDEP